MRVTVVTLSLIGGGAERVIALQANHWARIGWDVTIISFVDEGRMPPAYDIDPAVARVSLDLYRESPNTLAALKANTQRFSALRREIRASQPDVVIAHLAREIALTKLATLGLGVPVVGYFHAHPKERDPRLAWHVLEQWSYANVDAMIFQTEGAAQMFGKSARKRCTVIPNPIPEPRRTAVAASAPRRQVVVTVGGMLPVKNHALLLRAFARIARDYPDWTLEIAGDGIERPHLESLRRELALTEKVHFLGWVKDVDGLLASASIFVFPSNSEGFGQALCEALMLGLPAIATDAGWGVRDILLEGEAGLIVPLGDEAALADGIARLMSSDSLRRDLAEKGRASVARFSAEKVYAVFDAFLIRLVRSDKRHE